MPESLLYLALMFSELGMAIGEELVKFLGLFISFSRFCGRWLGIAGPSISIPRYTYNAVNAAKTLCTQGKTIFQKIFLNSMIDFYFSSCPLQVECGVQ